MKSNIEKHNEEKKRLDMMGKCLAAYCLVKNWDPDEVEAGTDTDEAGYYYWNLSYGDSDFRIEYDKKKEKASVIPARRK